jgi:hypothetical protein
MNKRAAVLVMVGLLACAGASAAPPADTGTPMTLPPGLLMRPDKSVISQAPRLGRTLMPGPARTRLTAIYDSLATRDPTGIYMAGAGTIVTGPQSFAGQNWVASAFTPAANAVVMEVQVGAGTLTGPSNPVMITIFADSAGLPGAALWSAETTATLPAFGSCCAVVAVKIKDGLAVAAGVQYWLGLTTLSAAPDTMAAWSYNVADQIDPGIAAENAGSGWVSATIQPSLAFAILGT